MNRSGKENRPVVDFGSSVRQYSEPPSRDGAHRPRGDSPRSRVHGLCQEAAMRKIIGAMKISVDGKTEGPEGYADWVEAWSDDFGLTPQIDACVLGGGMYPNYEQYWTAIQDAPGRSE